MNRDDLQEPCPKCGTQHRRGPYLQHQQNGVTRVGPHDVKCTCGLVLHWSVPIFKTTESGYVLRVLRDDEAPFLPENAKGAEAPRA
jgi:hypothetical protein